MKLFERDHMTSSPSFFFLLCKAEIIKLFIWQVPPKIKYVKCIFTVLSYRDRVQSPVKFSFWFVDETAE